MLFKVKVILIEEQDVLFKVKVILIEEQDGTN